MLTCAFGASIAASITTAYGCAGMSPGRIRAPYGVARGGEHEITGKEHQREAAAFFFVVDANLAALVELRCGGAR